ncbi:MAG: transglycosylase domain-containing protein [Solobacterium sp.]|nr:transglycosylase domain-containing protein [Solobacterium sp.]
MEDFEKNVSDFNDYEDTQYFSGKPARKSVFNVPPESYNNNEPVKRTTPPDFPSASPASAPASSSPEPASEPVKRQPLKSPRTRPTISTNRVFSPYDLSFFEDPVTTRDMNDSERARMSARRSAGGSGRVLTADTNVFPSGSSSGASTRSSLEKILPSSNGTSSPRTASAPVNSSRAPRQQASPYKPNAAGKTSSGPILTPDNNFFPEDSRSIRNTAQIPAASSNRPAASSNAGYGTQPKAFVSEAPKTTVNSKLSSVSYGSSYSASSSSTVDDPFRPRTTSRKAAADPSKTQVYQPMQSIRPFDGMRAAPSQDATKVYSTSSQTQNKPPVFKPVDSASVSANTASAPVFKPVGSGSSAAGSASAPVFKSADSGSASIGFTSAPASRPAGAKAVQPPAFNIPQKSPAPASQKPVNSYSTPSSGATLSFSSVKEPEVSFSGTKTSVFSEPAKSSYTAPAFKAASAGTAAAASGAASGMLLGATAAGTAALNAAALKKKQQSDALKKEPPAVPPVFNSSTLTPSADNSKTVTVDLSDVRSLDQKAKDSEYDAYDDYDDYEDDYEYEDSKHAKTKEYEDDDEEYDYDYDDEYDDEYDDDEYEDEEEEEQPEEITPLKGKKTKQTETGTGGPNDPDGPGKKKAGSSGKPKKWFVILTAVLVVAVVLELIAGITGIVMINKMTSNSPDLNLTDFVGEESTKIYDDQGELVTEVGVYLRQNITYDKCPEALVDAFLSVEDSRFFSHFGFDIPRFTKALIDNIKTHSFGQGGSTFTMQLVKNTYFSVESMNAEDTGTERTKSIEYKVQQIYLAMKLEKLLSKKEIFTLYLNKLNFGGNIRGVQRASQYYFGKNCNELNLSEAAMLAGIVNLPNRYNPYDYLDYGTTRRNEVLQLMKYHGYITDDELKLAKGIKVEDTLVGDVREATEDSQYQSYIDVVLEEAMELTGSDPTVRGMSIYTHLNRQMQEEVETIQNGESTVVFPDDLIQVAMISMDNRNGAIVAIGGGRNYDGARLLNRATMNYKQPGSSVKPLLSYALAFEYLGYSLDEVLLDKPITYPMESMVLVNASGNYAGDVTIKDAVGNSLNIPAILTLERVVNKIGPEKVVEYLQSIGFSRVKQENFHLSYAIGGTTFETTCKELAGAHAMLINKGIYNQPHTIEKVVMSSDGSEYYSANQNVRALSSGSAYLATELEANNVTGSYFNYMQVLARSYPVYAKTGTTDWGSDGVQYGIPRGQMKDKWMVASTSQYTNCVWVGYDKAEKGKETYYTSYKSSLNIPGNINRLLLNKEEEIWGVPEAIPAPDDVQSVTYIYGTFPHVRAEFAMDGGGTVTSLVSSAGLESMPMVSVDEYLQYAASESEYLGLGGISARFDQMGILTVSWGGANGICSGSERNISLHDAYNDIDQWGACLADLSWLVGGGEYWGTVYVDDNPIGEISSNNGFYKGYVGDLYGQVKVCGGSSTADGSDNTACTVAQYYENPDVNGYIDENGNWVQIEVQPDYSQYGYWDENGNWVGQGHWDDTGFHLE